MYNYVCVYILTSLLHTRSYRSEATLQQPQSACQKAHSLTLIPNAYRVFEYQDDRTVTLTIPQSPALH